MGDLELLTAAVRAFRNERDWGQFHYTKNLISSIAIEAAELMECVNWVEGEEAEVHGSAGRRAIEAKVVKNGEK